jgi:hypothetical protein
MERLLVWWVRVVGVLLVLLGLVLLIDPEVMLRWRERVLHTPAVDVSAKRERVVVVPRVVSVAIIGVGVVMLVRARRSA